MISRKLSDPEKQQILELYHLPGETTSTLASRYGVSNSTISRILKQGLPADEYELLIQQKRAGRFATDDEPAASVLLSAETVDKAALSLEQLDLGFSASPIASEPEVASIEEPDQFESDQFEPDQFESDQFEQPRRRVRRRSSASDSPNEEVAVEPDVTEVAETSYQTE
ncbi:MAG TPA: sigma factor-like helix-turn-helix DNA-binding protein, partial [Microcoleaceae cyanobacterium]